MAREMRNRFVLALVFTLAILGWSDVGKSVFGSRLATPLGLDRNVWLLLLACRCSGRGCSLPGPLPAAPAHA
jgi:P-type Cu2+ transporter